MACLMLSRMKSTRLRKISRRSVDGLIKRKMPPKEIKYKITLKFKTTRNRLKSSLIRKSRMKRKDNCSK